MLWKKLQRSWAFANGFALQTIDLSMTLSLEHSKPLTWLLPPPPQPTGKPAGNQLIQHGSDLSHWTIFCLVPQLVSGSAAEQIYSAWCSQDCTKMRANQALHFRDVCMLRRGWKHKSGQQTCKSLLCIPSVLASLSSLSYIYLLCSALFENTSNCYLRWQMSFASMPLPQ